MNDFAIFILVVLHTTIELNVDGDLVSRELPRVVVQPVIWNFHLIAINNLLLEDSIAVTETVAPSWVVECRHAIQETSRQTSKATVAQRGVMFLGNDILNTEAKIVQAI
jgi:hypothetical protein